MADRIIQSDSGNDVIIQNDDASSKIEINNDGTLNFTGTIPALQVDNIKVDGNTITSEDSNGNILLTPNGTGEVDISKVDIDSGTIDGADITVGSGKTLNVSAGTLTSSSAQKDAIVDGSTAISRSGNNLTFAGTVGNTGDNTITSGNFVIGTAGKGIDYSTQTPAAGMTAEILDHYEEGTFTPAFTATGCTWTTSSAAGFYTRIGDLVSYTLWIQTTAVSGSTSNGLSITGLPFNANSTTNYFGVASVTYAYNFDGDAAAGGFVNWRQEAAVARLDPIRSRDDDTTQGLLASATDANPCRLVIGGQYRTA